MYIHDNDYYTYQLIGLYIVYNDYDESKIELFLDGEDFKVFINELEVDYYVLEECSWMKDGKGEIMIVATDSYTINIEVNDNAITYASIISVSNTYDLD